jgi:hypothetical protein
MPFLYRNNLVVVLRMATGQDQFCAARFLRCCIVTPRRSGESYEIGTENRLSFAVFWRSELSPTGLGQTIADFDVWETGNLDAATTSVAY